MSVEKYIEALEISNKTSRDLRAFSKSASILPANIDAAVDVSSVLSFVSNVDASERLDILFSVQLAQRAADAVFNRFNDTAAWYGRYVEVLEKVGWATEQFAFAKHHQSEGAFTMDKAALDVISAIASANQLQAITASISALKTLSDSDRAITVFEYHASGDSSGNFQIGAVQKANNGSLSMALGAFYFHASTARRKFLFAGWGRNEVDFWTAAQRMTFNDDIYGKVRDVVRDRLGKQAVDFIAEINIR